MSELAIGDHVAYSADFLRSICCYTGDIPAARGIITALKPLGTRVTIATVEWDREDIPAKVITTNIAKVGSLGFSAT